MGWIKLKEIGMKESHIRKLMKLYKNYEDLYNNENFKLFNDDLKFKLEKANKINLSNILEKYEKCYPFKVICSDDLSIFLFSSSKCLLSSAECCFIIVSKSWLILYTIVFLS